jgi:serine protease Do
MKKFKILFLFFSLFLSNLLTFNSLAQEKLGEVYQEKPAFKTQISSSQIGKNGFADIVENLLPSVVNISAIQNSPNKNIDLSFLDDLSDDSAFSNLRDRVKKDPNLMKNQVKKSSSVGSGFLISKDGFIVTNNHVIEDAKEIKVSLNDGRKFDATIIGTDEETDLALLKIESDEELPFATFGDSFKARIGDWVIVIGNPYGLGGSVSVGIVSANNRSVNRLENFIQTDAAINKGNSGGPMFNINGEVIGVNSALFSPSGGSVGIGFANPSSLAFEIISQLMENGEVIRGWIGVSVQNISQDYAKSAHLESQKGAFIIEVMPQSPAHDAGLIQGDVILEFDKKEILDMKDLPKIVVKSEVGRRYKMRILRNGKERIISIKIGKMPKNSRRMKKNI